MIKKEKAILLKKIHWKYCISGMKTDSLLQSKIYSSNKFNNNFIFISKLYIKNFRTKEFNDRGAILKKIKSEKLGYLEYAEKMHKLSTHKRKAICDKKKNYCQELLKKLREDIKN